MKNEYLSIEEKIKICSLLQKEGITDEKILEVEDKMLEFCGKKKRLPEPTTEEREKLDQLRHFYERNREENPRFTGKIFSLHKELLDSLSPKIKRKALGMAEEIIKKYKVGTPDILRSISNKK